MRQLVFYRRDKLRRAVVRHRNDVGVVGQTKAIHLVEEAADPGVEILHHVRPGGVGVDEPFRLRDVFGVGLLLGLHIDVRRVVRELQVERAPGGAIALHKIDRTGGQRFDAFGVVVQVVLRPL